jgi:hypothetical protein
MKRLLLVFFGSFVAYSSLCQHMTLQVGPSISHLEWTHSANNKTLFSIPNPSVNVLIGKNYIPLKYFFLNSSVGYIQKGGKDSLVVGPEGISGDPIAKVQMHYITVNTTANLQFPIKDKVFPFLSLGPRLDYLIGYNENVSFLLPYDSNGELDRLIYGLIAGGGVNFKVKRLLVGAVFSYYFNFNKIINYTQPYSSTHSELIDRTFTINATVGYLF